MSTRGSILFAEFTEKLSIHIYKEMMDDYYYIENEQGVCIRLPNKEVAEAISNALKKFEKVRE